MCGIILKYTYCLKLFLRTGDFLKAYHLCLHAHLHYTETAGVCEEYIEGTKILSGSSL